MITILLQKILEQVKALKTNIENLPTENVYSETEHQIGIWSNKPIYQKTFVMETSIRVGTSLTNTYIDTSNIKNIIQCIGMNNDGTLFNYKTIDPTMNNHKNLGLASVSGTATTDIISLMYIKNEED